MRASPRYAPGSPVKGDRYLRRAEDAPDDSAFDKVAREAIWRWVTPRWRRHLTRVLEAERDVDAVVVFTVPMAHFRGIPSYLRERFGVPVVFYDGDVPMSLPEFGGMDTGFNYYHGADPSEYDLVVSNSEAGSRGCTSWGPGARRRSSGPPTLSSSRRGRSRSCTTYSSTVTAKFRREWMAAMVGDPSRAAPELEFAFGGRDFQGDTGGRGWSATCPSMPSRRRSRPRGST